MRQFPVFLTLRDRTVVVVGGTEAAAGKVRLLLRSGARIILVATRMVDTLEQLVTEGRVHIHRGPFTPDLLEEAALVFAATDNAHANAWVHRHARRRNVPINVVDVPALCTFTMPAIVDRNPLLVAIGSDGAAPVLVRRLRSRLERTLPQGLGRLADFAGRLRYRVARTLPDSPSRRRFWERFFSGPAPDWVIQDDAGRARIWTENALNGLASSIPVGQVALVGAGPGDPELLTLKALRHLEQADVIVHDRLVPAAILEHARRDARRIDVGKQAGRHALPQSDINALLVALAREGLRVCRLKGGDPFVFGRGGEEVEALLAADVPFELVPGITAAVGCGAAAGIPLTHRDLAQSVTCVTGHRRDGGALDLDWSALARDRHTVVFYMGTRNLGQICTELQSHGAPGDRQAALVENGTRADQRVLRGTLATLPDLASGIGFRGPTLIVIGDVVGLMARPDRIRWGGIADPEPAHAIGS